MAKRFTATDKWDDPWFGSLSITEKLFWTYLCDKCDHAGIWQVNWPLVNFHIPGYTFDPLPFAGRIVVLSPQKLYLPKFVTFQYGQLNPDNRTHQSVIRILAKEGASTDLVSPLLGAKGTDKGTGKVIKDVEVDVRKESEKTKRFTPPTPTEVAQYAKDIGFTDLDSHSFCDFYEAKGWVVGKSPMKDWKAAVRTWRKNNFGGNHAHSNNASRGYIGTETTPGKYAALAENRDDAEEDRDGARRVRLPARRTQPGEVDELP